MSYGVAEDVLRAAVGLLNRCAGEADKRRIGQGVAHMLGKAIVDVGFGCAFASRRLKVILASVRLVHDKDDVSAIRQHRVPFALRGRQEVLDGGKQHAARHPAVQHLAQMGAALRLLRGLAQEFAAPAEGGEELVVQIGAVGQHNEVGFCMAGCWMILPA